MQMYKGEKKEMVIFKMFFEESIESFTILID
ncbi:hypothetical protein M2480_001271 [Parabacteroides sp. PFB2-12]|nr:hypothetical protein [Parabacteroides sp. PM6-13]MDH6390298.1 hypothetical protein [Parabacteroides sp. PFB2-12]